MYSLRINRHGRASAPNLGDMASAARYWLRGGSRGLARAYAAGDFEPEDLSAVIESFASWFPWRAHQLPRVTKLRARQRTQDLTKNIQAHYDSYDEELRRILGPNMLYSALPSRSSGNLAERETAFISDTLELLDCEPHHKVVDLGCGWGALTMELTRRGCDVSAFTLSDAQRNHMERELSVEDLVTDVRLQSWDSAEEPVDRIVCVEMLEHVDWGRHREFFEHCAKVLRPGGLAYIQATVMPHVSALAARHREDVVTGELFPGATIPSSRHIIRSATAAGLRIVWREESSQWYERTLQDWAHHASVVGASEIDPRRYRLLEFYLVYSRVGFLLQHLSTTRLLLKAV